jgi:Glycosyl hydrolases family 25/Putative Ig domain
VEYSGYAPGAQMLPLTLDIEYDPYVASDGTNECYGLSPAQMTTWIAAFVATARALTGQYPIIYTTADWWHTCTGGSTAFAADPMWVAAYETSAPPLPAGWASWTYWQYTSVGTVPGVDSKGSTDLDTFSPTAVALIDPGTLASRPLAQVSIPIGSLGADTGETLTWAAASLPPGIRLTSQGVLTGLIMNPPVNAIPGRLTYQPTVTAQNTSGGTSTVTFTWHVPVACPNHPFVGICPST